MYNVIKYVLNVEYRLFDKEGNEKPIFQENALAWNLIKGGKLSPMWITQWYAPLISPFLGSMSSVKIAPNKIVNAGLALAAACVNGSGSPVVPTYIAVGTGTNAVTAADTALQTELASSGLTRATSTVSLQTTNVTNDTSQWLKSFSVTGTQAVTESGVFNAASGPTMLTRQTFSAINVVNSDTLQVTWKIAWTSAN